MCCREGVAARDIGRDPPSHVIPRVYCEDSLCHWCPSRLWLERRVNTRSLGHWEKVALPTLLPSVSPPDAGSSNFPKPDAATPTTSTVTSTLSTELLDAGNTSTVDASLEPTLDVDASSSGLACLENLGMGQLSPVNTELRVTETATDWSLTEPVSEMEWTITIEQDIPTPNEEIGYYWHNQFSFVPGVAGRFGLQSRGLYQETPTEVGTFTKIVVFWLSGPPLAAELGDIKSPDARTFEMPAAGLRWGTIHAKFDWQECHTYRFRVGIESTDADGNMWYGAWITDETTATVTFLGRMLLPKDTGLLSSFSSSRTSPIYFDPVVCADLKHVSAVFGAPTSGTQTASFVANHFMPPVGCARSIIGNFGELIRHELGASP